MVPIIAAFRRMVRDLEFDVCEMAPTTYMIARTRGAPYTALPIFLMRRFHHGGFVVRPDANIRAPKDLEGKKVGVRAYSVTTGVWTRGIFVNEYGLDSSKVTWWSTTRSTSRRSSCRRTSSTRLPANRCRA
jgi:4,5-dihydroxyphthalate decarboxylase